LHPDTTTTADICGELVLTEDSGARSVMTVPWQRSTTERATAARHLDDATGTSKKRLRSVSDKTLKATPLKESQATVVSTHKMVLAISL